MFKTILIPVDVAVPDDAARLLAAAKTLTADWSSDLHVVTVIPNVGMPIVGSYFDDGFEQKSVDAAKAQLSKVIADAGIDAQQKVLTGRVYDGIISYAARVAADLIVVGAHQPDFRDYLLGANAARVVRHSKQSVLVLRDAD